MFSARAGAYLLFRRVVARNAAAVAASATITAPIPNGSRRDASSAVIENILPEEICIEEVVAEAYESSSARHSTVETDSHTTFDIHMGGPSGTTTTATAYSSSAAASSSSSQSHAQNQQRPNTMGREGGPSQKPFGTTSGSGGSVFHATDVAAIDTFSKGKVLNFIRRMAREHGTTTGTLMRANRQRIAPRIMALFFPDGGKFIFDNVSGHHKGGVATSAANVIFTFHEERMILESSSETTSNGDADVNGGPSNDAEEDIVIRCRMRLLLPPPHYFAVAEGIARTERDAEALAAMHAERVIDACGVPLFGLPSMQQRHAEAAKADGRWAPTPEDAIRDAGVPLPPPLRMLGNRDFGGPSSRITTTTNSSNDATASGASATVSAATSDAAASEGGSASSSGLGEGKAPEGGADAAASASAASNGVAGNEAAGADRFRMDQSIEGITEFPPGSTVATMYCLSPWAFAAMHRAPTLPANIIDATEGGAFQLVNCISNRFSPSTHAVSLPSIYDRDAALKRVLAAFPKRDSSTGDVFVQRPVVEKDVMTVTHVVVPGAGMRMFVAEAVLALPNGRTVIARGKAHERQIATHLCGMHAELLFDWYGIRVYPNDPTKQLLHAKAAMEAGRWAPVPPALRTSVDWFTYCGFPIERSPAEITDASAGGGATVVATSGGLTSADAALLHPPLPLKQMQGGFGDEDGLQALGRTAAQHRSVYDRIVMTHSEVNIRTINNIECFPDAALLREAQDALADWQRRAGSYYRRLMIFTRMGDFIRASTVLPLPDEFGVRGGMAIGRTPEQAASLCAFHAVDVLCTLGVPLYEDAEKQRDFAERRKQLGLSYYFPPTADATATSSGSYGGEGASMPDDAAAQGDAAGDIVIPELVGDSTPNSVAPAAPGGGSALPVQRYVKTGAATVGGKAARIPRPTAHPHTPSPPGYIIEGAESRPMATMESVAAILCRSHADFEVLQGADQDIINKGNVLKPLVQLYLKRTGQSGAVGPGAGAIMQLGTQQSSLTCHGMMALPFTVYVPPEGVGLLEAHTHPSTLPLRVAAVGAAPKKKDADRACYMHAAAILKACGVDVEQERALEQAELKRQKELKQRQRLEQEQALAAARRAEKAAKAAAAAAAVRAAAQGAKRPPGVVVPPAVNGLASPTTPAMKAATTAIPKAAGVTGAAAAAAATPAGTGAPAAGPGTASPTLPAKDSKPLPPQPTPPNVLPRPLMHPTLDVLLKRDAAEKAARASKKAQVRSMPTRN